MACDCVPCRAVNFHPMFGALVTKFAEQSSPEHAELRKQLEKAANDRNDLAHHYFWDRAVGFCSSEGRTQMIEELVGMRRDRKSTRLNSSHLGISYAVFCLKKKI